MVLNTTKGIDNKGNDASKTKPPDTAFSVNEHKDKNCHYALWKERSHTARLQKETIRPIERER
jgi:hypothetical protein